MNELDAFCMVFLLLIYKYRQAACGSDYRHRSALADKKNKVRRVHPWTVKSGTTPVITARKIDRTVLPPQADHAPHFFLCNIHYQPMFLWPLRSGIYFVFIDPSETISSLPAARDEAGLNRNSLLAPLISYSTIEPQDRSIQHLSAKRNPQENAGTEPKELRLQSKIRVTTRCKSKRFVTVLSLY